jgi:hypothetical protein
LERNTFKIFTKLLTNRITELTKLLIPDNQFGFRKGISILHAIRNLMNDIQEALHIPGEKLYMVFINYAKAFDLLDRGRLNKKLEQATGLDHPWTTLLGTFSHTITVFTRVILALA